MPYPSTLLVFLVASLVLLVVPGPAVLYVVTRSISQGRRAGLVSVLGVHVGSVVHVSAAALGLSALLSTSATAFATVRYLGAAYLVWLGIDKLRRRRGPLTGAAPVPQPRRRLFGQGVVVNVLNPKTALFFLAFLPQFVSPGRGPVAAQVVVLGAVFIGLGLLSDGCYALLAAGIAARLRRSARVGERLERLSGLVYLGLGVTAAFAPRPEPAA